MTILRGNAGDSRILLGDAQRVIANDFGELFLGAMLGRGIARQVYVMRMDESRVVKIETAATSFQNVQEWTVWQALREVRAAAAWLAPCHHISECGTILIQSRTEPIRSSDLPARVPPWLTDLKLDNFGRFDGRIVCHDYPFSADVAIGRGAKGALRRAVWRS